MTALRSLVLALRVWLALWLIGLADRLLPTDFEATFYALRELADAIEGDCETEMREMRR